jgi:delta l-pyrroline-5-carboxylate synthetase
MDAEVRSAALRRVAAVLEENEEEILRVNAKDVAIAEETLQDKIPQATLQRLKLKPGKVAQLAQGIRSLAELEDPLGKVLRRTQVAEGLQLEQVASPLGVLLIIFEARPDALPQIAALSIRSGNGLLLKGGKEASLSNAFLHGLIAKACEEAGLPSGLTGLVQSRDEIADLLKLDTLIDLVIPRGSGQLVRYIQENTKIPVLGHADGVCHIYVDKEAAEDKVLSIVVDSKVDYPAACNAAETILFHQDTCKDKEDGSQSLLKKTMEALRAKNVKLYGGERASKVLGLPPAPHAKHEYGDLEITLEIVDSQEHAIDFIHTNGSGHTDAILTEDKKAAADFMRQVDSACVFHNASTRFSDGFRFGLGAEVGISTSRIHARGPVGVDGLLTTRWLMRGDGHIVNKDQDIEYLHESLPIDE